MTTTKRNGHVSPLIRPPAQCRRWRTSSHRQIRTFRCYWPRSGGQVAWLCVLHVPRCDLGLGRTSGLPPVASFEVQIRALVQIFLAMGNRLLSVVFGPWAGGMGKIV